jgi:hypothetical protein
MGNCLKQGKSELLKAIVKIVSEIRKENQNLSEVEADLKLLESFLKKISISSEGAVHAIFSEELLKNDQ